MPECGARFSRRAHFWALLTQHRARVAAPFGQVAAELGPAVRIVKVDTDAEPDLSSQLQVRAGSGTGNGCSLAVRACRQLGCARPFHG